MRFTRVITGAGEYCTSMAVALGAAEFAAQDH